jgi:hypothetical protein
VCAPKHYIVLQAHAAEASHSIHSARAAQAAHRITPAAPSWIRSSCVSKAASHVFVTVAQGLVVAAYLGSGIVDDYVAQGQRKAMGLCVKCGGLYEGSEKPCAVEGCPQRGKWQGGDRA